ncbi:MAG TPA: alpha/beta hydrolase [Oscillatoriaceae cyanobacterium]
MAISNLSPRVVSPRLAPVASPSVKAPSTPAPAKPASAPVPSQPKPSLWQRFERWILSPYLNYVGKKGAQQFMYPGRQADSTTPAQLGLQGQTLNFTSADGKTPISGWYIPAVPASDKTIVLAHGHGGQMGEMLSEYAPWLHKAGYNIVAFDFRGSGSSGGDRSTIGYEERDDLKAAIDQAVAKGGKNIAVLGVSQGGATALEQAARDPRVNAVIDDCAFDSLYDAVLPRLQAATLNIGPLKIHYPFTKLGAQAIVDEVTKETGEPVASTDPIKLMPKLANRPVMIIHGAADDETLPQDSVNLYNADPGTQKSLWMVPGAGHAESYKTDPKDYQQRVLNFLQTSL